MKAKSESHYWSIIVPAIILRLFFSSFFFHPDIKSQHFHAQFLGQGVINIYQFIDSHLITLPYRDTFNYPPLTYFLLGSWNKVAGLIIGPETLTNWLNDWGPGGYFHPRMFEIMLVLKFPYLILDLFTGYLLLKYISDPKLTGKILKFWFFNPISLYAVYMLSQFDIICAVLTVAALIFVKEKKLYKGAILLGFGTVIKSYPLLLLPFLLMRSKNIKEISVSLLLFFFGFIVPVLPVISSPAFRYTMSHSNLMQSIFTAGLDISATQKIPFYVVIYVLALIYSWFRKKSTDLLPEFLTTTFFVVLLSNFHAQWIVWAMPFLAILWTRISKDYWPLFLACMFGFFITNLLIPDQYVFLGLFSPINNQSVIYPNIYSMLKPLVDSDLIQSVARTVLLGSGIILVYKSWSIYDKN